MPMHRSRKAAHSRVLHLGKLLLYLFLSAADLAMTLYLVNLPGGHIYEGNPVAGAWLSSFGGPGLAVFKVLAATQVVLACVVICRHRPRLGGAILSAACGVTGAVVIYSACLCFYHGPSSRSLAQDAHLVDDETRSIESQRRSQQDYQTLLNRLGDDLATHRCSMTQAIHEVARSPRMQNPFWLRRLREKYPGRTDAECIGLHVSLHTLLNVSDNPGAMERVRWQLESDFRASFRTSLFNPSPSQSAGDVRTQGRGTDWESLVREPVRGTEHNIGAVRLLNRAKRQAGGVGQAAVDSAALGVTFEAESAARPLPRWTRGLFGGFLAEKAHGSAAP
jgi:hypothetical protein